MKLFVKYYQYFFVFFLFLILSIWWLLLHVSGPENDLNNQVFAASYGIMALIGGIWGLIAANKWGGLKSIFGRAISLFSLGLLFQEFGQLSYSYYIYFAKVEVPYPSLGDIGFFGSIPLYIYGIILLGKVCGVKFQFKTFATKIISVLIPLGLLAVVFWLFLKDYEYDWSSPLTVLLDFGYPIGQALYVSFAVLVFSLTRNVLGGMMKSRILLVIVAFIAQYIADFVFLYLNHIDNWSVGGINDYQYLVSYTVMTVALFQLNSVFHSIRDRQ